MRILELLHNHSAIYVIGYFVAIIVAITFHEFAHAWMADYLGDNTPRLQGRVSLNPADHLDPIGSIMFLLLGFGWGRPVIYNPMNLKRRSDELLIALAGPISNLLLATFFNLVIFLIQPHIHQSLDLLGLAADLNVLLAAFNFIPIPPLDGSSIIAYFWPQYRSLVGGQIGMVILLAAIFLPIPFFGNALGLIITPLQTFFTLLTHLFGLI